MQTLQAQDPARAKTFFEQKVAFTTGPVEVDHMIKAGDSIVVVDVRDAEDYTKGHVPGAINLPKAAWENPKGLQKDKTHIVYCYTQQCHLAANACITFADKGFRVMEMEGGFEGWKDSELETDTEPANRMQDSGEMAGRRR